MELWFLQFVVCPFSFLFIFYLYHKQKPTRKPVNATLKIYPLIGNLPEFIRNRHRFLEWSTEILAGSPTNTFKLQFIGRMRGITTANPLNLEHVLKTNFQNYPKGERFITLLEDFLGRGIFNSDEEQWKLQRKTASFEFNTRSLRNFVLDSIQREIQDRLLPLLQKTSRSGAVIDIQDVLERFAFDSVCRLAFGEDPACLGESLPESDFARAFEDAATISAGRFMYALPYVWRLKKFCDFGSEKKLRESISIVHNFAEKIIRTRKEEMSQKKTNGDEWTVAIRRDDLLSRFITHQYFGASDEFLRDIVISFLLAGRDTTSSGLTWFFWLLSSRPEISKKILVELETVRRQSENLGENTMFGFEELKEMHYLHAAISEAMRLYPPVAVDTKACREDDVWPDGTFVGKDWFVSYNSYAMGRMEKVWGEDCLEFSPERWLTEEGVFRPENPYKFPIFHGGPRICLGKEMAYIQMKSIAACILERFEIDVQRSTTSPPEYTLSLTLRMKGGLPIRLRERSGSWDQEKKKIYI